MRGASDSGIGAPAEGALPGRAPVMRSRVAPAFLLPAAAGASPRRRPRHPSCEVGAVDLTFRRPTTRQPCSAQLDSLRGDGGPIARRTDGQARRRAIGVLAATSELLGEGVSYADLNIERIATRAGISRTAFYFYFRDKRELLLRLTEDVTDELYRQGDIWFSGAGEPTAEVAEALQKIGALYREHGAVLRAIVQAAATDDEVAVFWHAILDRFVDATARRIDELRSDGGTVVAEDARATAFALCWMIERAFNQQLVLGEPIAHDQLVAALSGIFVRAVYGT